MDRREMLQMALVGYRKQADIITQRIEEIEEELRQTEVFRIPVQVVRGGATRITEKPKRKLSVQGRANIIAGVKKRWAKHHKLAKAG